MSFSGLGALGWLGFAPEGSGGVVAQPAHFSTGLSESLTLSLDRYELANMAGSLAEPDDAAGVRRVGGETSMAADPINLGYALAAILDPIQTVEIASGTIFSHLFRTHQVSAWDNRYALPPFTIWVNRNVAGGAFAYAGCNATALEISVAPNEAINARLNWIGTGFSVVSPAPVASFATVTPLKFDQASISLAGAANADIESMKLTIQRPLEDIPTLRGSAYSHKIKASDFAKIRLSMSIGFDTIADLERFRQQTTQALRINIAADSFGLLLDLPSIVYTAFPTGLGGRGRQVAQVDATGRFHAGSGTALDVTLLSPKGWFVIPPPAFSLLAK